jgi:hypothetical protein
MAFHPGVALMNKNLLISCGGWPGLETMEDKLPIFLVSELAGGVSIPEPAHIYNRHSSQVTSSLDHRQAKKHALDFTCEVLTQKRRSVNKSAPSVFPRKLV